MQNIDDVLTRGVVNIIPGKEELKKTLKSGKKLNVYLGIDPTAPRIHLGHAVPLIKLQKFTKLGHNVTLLIGDFTALVGDTSDKESERPILTPKEIKKNLETYKEQAEKIIDFSKIKLVHNSDWLSKLYFKDVIELTQRFSLNDFSSRELIKKRFKEDKHIRLDEVLYPAMQGYDSYFLDTDIQIGAADQTFNMQAGRTLQKKLRDKESYILATEYLPGTDGRKMSKSWGNAIWLDDGASEMYRKIMSINDNLIVTYFTLVTHAPSEEIEDVKNEVESNPLDAKKKLAKEIVSELYSEKDAKKAADEFEKTVQKKETPSEIEELEIKEGKDIVDVLVESNLTVSKSDAKRMIEQGGVELDGVKMKLGATVKEGVLRVGKHKFLKLVTSD